MNAEVTYMPALVDFEESVCASSTETEKECTETEKEWLKVKSVLSEIARAPGGKSDKVKHDASYLWVKNQNGTWNGDRRKLSMTPLRNRGERWRSKTLRVPRLTLTWDAPIRRKTKLALTLGSWRRRSVPGGRLRGKKMTHDQEVDENPHTEQALNKITA